MIYPWDVDFVPPTHWRFRELANLTDEQFVQAAATTNRALRKAYWKLLLKLPLELLKGNREISIDLMNESDLWIPRLTTVRRDYRYADGYMEAWPRHIVVQDQSRVVVRGFAGKFRFIDFYTSDTEGKEFSIAVPTWKHRMRRLRQDRAQRRRNKAYFRSCQS